MRLRLERDASVEAVTSLTNLAATQRFAGRVDEAIASYRTR